MHRLEKFNQCICGLQLIEPQEIVLLLNEQVFYQDFLQRHQLFRLATSTKRNFCTRGY
jgi:hypothetical protein